MILLSHETTCLLNDLNFETGCFTILHNTPFTIHVGVILNTDLRIIGPRKRGGRELIAIEREKLLDIYWGRVDV